MTADEDWLLGIEVGGTKLQLGVGRADGTLIPPLERRPIHPEHGAGAIREQILAVYREILCRHGVSPPRLRGVGLGFGGPVDVANGRIQASFQVPGWTDFPLVDWLRQAFEVPAVQVQNDADTAGLAESCLGAGVGCSPLLYLTIGSGIGGALILDQRIYRGGGLGAVEIGHMQVPVQAESGIVFRELEQVASGWGIARAGQVQAIALREQGGEDWDVLRRANGDPGSITARLVAEAAAENDPLAGLILDRAHRALAFVLRQAIVLLGPRRIILGGGVSLIGEDHWFAPLRRLVAEEVFSLFAGSYDIVPAALGEDVVVHGALLLARDAAREAAGQRQAPG